jgi:signal peptidase II
MKRANWLLFGFNALWVVLADQITKWIAVSHLTNAFKATATAPAAVTFAEQLDRFLYTLHPNRIRSVEVFENFWHFRYVENPGAAFGFLADQEAWLRLPLFITITIVATGFICWMFRETTPEQRLMRFTLGIILGGAIGNFIDRIRLGYVIDFIDWHWYEHNWPTFNIADAAISVGVALLVVEMIKVERQNAEQAKDS